MVRLAGERYDAFALLSLMTLTISARSMSVLIKMNRFTLGFALVYLLFSLCLAQNVFAQAGTREIRLTVFLDYAHAQLDSDGSVIFDGTVDSPVPGHPDLQTLGFREEYGEPLPLGKQVTQQEAKKWSVRGSISTARLTFPQKDEWYHLHLGPLTLSPDDNLTLILPYVNLDYQHITPLPDNIKQLQDLVADVARSDNIPPKLFELTYTNARLNGNALDIPFTPIRKQIDLTLTPLVGEMLLKPKPSFRLSGHVIFDQIHDYVEFRWDCPADPALQVNRYSAAHLLFGLDSPPGLISSGMLSELYQSKRTHSRVRVDSLSCSYDAKKGGHVEATFNGQVVSQIAPTFPEKWVDTAESNIAKPDHGEYALEMGDIVLAPSDVLTVTIPGVGIHQIDPPPTRVNSTRGHITEFVYEGPLYSKITMVYEPEANLILSQLHTAARTGTRLIEQMLGPFWGRNARAISLDSRLIWWLGLLAVTLFAARITVRNAKLKRWTHALAWPLAALIMFYGFRGVYGLLVVAVLIYLNAGIAARPFVGYLARGAAAMLLILIAMFLDQLAAANLFAVLQALEIETTPITPLILFVLGLGLATLLMVSAVQFARLFPRVIFAIVLALVSLALFDALQKSLLGLAVLGIGIAYVLRHLKNNSEGMNYVEVIARLKLAWNGRLIPIGFVILILFAAQNGLQSTTAVLGSTPSILRALAPPLLLFISILTSFLATGLLFIILYPILPFHIGYLKAAAFGLFLLLIFFVGIGADENLASTWQTLIIGRFVYYLGVPLLIGLFFDITALARELPTGTGTGEPTPAPRLTAKVIPERLKDLRTLLSTLGSIITLVAPGIYAYFAHEPLLINYFDLLETLLSLSAK
jgi:hypothetical protein